MLAVVVACQGDPPRRERATDEPSPSRTSEDAAPARAPLDATTADAATTYEVLAAVGDATALVVTSRDAVVAVPDDDGTAVIAVALTDGAPRELASLAQMVVLAADGDAIYAAHMVDPPRRAGRRALPRPEVVRVDDGGVTRVAAVPAGVAPEALLGVDGGLYVLAAHPIGPGPLVWVPRRGRSRIVLDLVEPGPDDDFDPIGPGAPAAGGAGTFVSRQDVLYALDARRAARAVWTAPAFIEQVAVTDDAAYVVTSRRTPAGHDAMDRVVRELWRVAVPAGDAALVPLDQPGEVIGAGAGVIVVVDDRVVRVVGDAAVADTVAPGAGRGPAALTADAFYWVADGELRRVAAP